MGKSAILFFFISLFVPQVIAMPKDQKEEKKAKKIIKPPQFIPSNVQNLYRSDIIKYFTINNKKLDIYLDDIKKFLNTKYLENAYIECRSIDSKALTVLLTRCKNLEIEIHNPYFNDVLRILCKDSELKNLESFSFSLNNFYSPFSESHLNHGPTIEFLNGIPCNLKKISLNNLVFLKFPKDRSLQNVKKFYWNNLNIPLDSNNLNIPLDSKNLNFLKLDGFKELFPKLDEVAIEIKSYQVINPLFFLEPFSTVEHVGLTIHMRALASIKAFNTMLFESYRYPINCEKSSIQLPLLFKKIDLLLSHDACKMDSLNLLFPRPEQLKADYNRKLNNLKEYLDINLKKETKFDTNSWFRFSLESTLSEISPITFTSSNVPQKINNISRYEPELHRFKPYNSKTFSLYND